MVNKDLLNKAIKRQFFKVPNIVLELGLSPYAIAVLLCMLRSKNSFNPSVRLISKMTGIHRNTIYKSIKELIRANIVHKASPSSHNRMVNGVMMPNKVTEYGFNNFSTWVKLKRKTNNVNVSKSSTEDAPDIS